MPPSRLPGRQPSPTSTWWRQTFRRVPCTRTTWTLRLGAVTVVAVLLWATSSVWTTAVGRHLVCDPDGASGDAILIDNPDGRYMPFEQAMALRRAGIASRVLVPVWVDTDTGAPNVATLAVAAALADVAHLGPYEIVPTVQREPIALNVAHDVLAFLRRERIGSVIVVSPLFRSRRSALVYSAVLSQAGVSVRCAPGALEPHVSTWTATWHGVQEVVEQWFKLQYYRVYVLPLRTPETTPTTGLP